MKNRFIHAVVLFALCLPTFGQACELKADTNVDILYGPFLDSTDGITAEVSLTITQAEIRLSKNGANMAQKSETTSLVHDEAGFYVLKLNTTDTNAEGQLSISNVETGALPMWLNCEILGAASYDEKYGTTTLLGDINTNVDSVLVDTAVIGVLGAGLTDLGGFSTAAMAEIESENNDALVALKLDHLVAVAESDDPVDNSIFAKIVHHGTPADWSSYVNTTDAVTQRVANQSAILVDTSTGVAVAVVNVSALADFFNTDSGTTYAASVTGSVVQEIVDNAAGASLTEAGIADAVWDETKAGHVGTTTFGDLATALNSVLTDTGTNGVVVGSYTAAGLADFFNTDSGTTYGASVAGSVVQEITDNSSGSGASAVSIRVEMDSNSTQLASMVGATVIFETTLATVPSQTQPTLTDNIGVDDWFNPWQVCIEDADVADTIDCMYVNDFVTSGNIITLSRTPLFTLEVGDFLRVTSVRRTF